MKTIWDVMRAARGAPGLDPSAKLLLLEILDRAGNGRGVCYASNATLGAAVGIGERHVRNGVKALEKAGWIHILRSGASKFSRRTIYIMLEWTPDEPGTTVPGLGKMHPEPQCREVGTTVPGDPEPQCHQTSPERQPELQTDGGEGSRTEGGRGGTLDRDAVLRVVAQCCYLPADAAEKLEARRDLAGRLKGDWEALALAIVRTEAGRASGNVGHIRKTVGFLLTVAGSVRGEEPPTPKELATLREMLDGTYKPPLKPGPVFYKAKPGEYIPLPSKPAMWCSSAGLGRPGSVDDHGPALGDFSLLDGVHGVERGADDGPCINASIPQQALSRQHLPTCVVSHSSNSRAGRGSVRRSRRSG